MRGFRLTLLFVVFMATVISLVAQESTPATVEGIVVRIGSGEPVPSVLIALREDSSGRMWSASTDTDGRFKIDGIPAGSHSLSAWRRGFIKPSRRSGPSALILREGEHLRDLRLQVQATAVISGRIVDENRRPRSGVTVQVLRYQYTDGRRVLAPVFTSASQKETNDRGEYRLYDLEPGEYRVQAVPGETGSQRLLGPVYYPGVANPEAAAPIQLTAGSEAAGIDFALTQAAIYSVRFKVANLPANTDLMDHVVRRGSPLLDRTTRISSCPSSEANTRTCNGLIPGTYDIITRTLNSLPTTVLYGRISATVVDRNVEAPTLILNPAVSIQGRVIIPDKLPVRVNPMDIEVSLSPPPPVSSGWFSAQVSDVAADATFKVDAGEGLYRIAVSGLPPEIYLESARYAGRDVTYSGITIEKTAAGTLELMLAGPAATVDGTVRTATGKPVADSRVVLLPIPGRRDNIDAFKSTLTDQAGAFSIEGVAPGEYSVLAWDDIEPEAHLSREFLERFEPRAVKIRIERGATMTVNISPVPE